MQARLGLQSTVRLPKQARRVPREFMSFLNWFKKKSRNTEAEGKPAGADESSSEPSTSTQTASGNAAQETAPDAPFIEQQSASPPVMPPSVTDTPKQPAS